MNGCVVVHSVDTDVFVLQLELSSTRYIIFQDFAGLLQRRKTCTKPWSISDADGRLQEDFLKISSGVTQIIQRLTKLTLLNMISNVKMNSIQNERTNWAECSNRHGVVQVVQTL